MKTYCGFILVILLILSTAFCFAQNGSDSAQLNFIKTQYGETDKDLKSYRKVLKTDTAETTEGNVIQLYFNGDEIKKIKAIYYGETGKAIKEYYFFNEKLMFCYFVEYKYDVPINATNGKVKTASKKEKRYYFKDDKIFLVWLKPTANGAKANRDNLTIGITKKRQRLMDL